MRSPQRDRARPESLAWGIDAAADVGAFTREQAAYLDYHHANVFRRDITEVESG